MSGDFKRAILEGFYTLVAFVFLIIALFLATPPHAQTIATAETGKLQEVMEDGINYFNGTPYAALPAGGVRRCPPQLPQSWKGIPSTTHFGHNCVQLPIRAEVSLDGVGVGK